jgi:trans-2,3-dihydro-3-hydroxyanthranilate isomerase
MNSMSNAKRRLPFVQVDVFTSVPLEGNQLAVFTDGSNLSDAEMQALAKEMNLSETTFILPRDPATERERGSRVRIFTVDEELPFAGHPTLGTAMVLRGNGTAEEIVLDLKVGRIRCAFPHAMGCLLA